MLHSFGKSRRAGWNGSPAVALQCSSTKHSRRASSSRAHGSSVELGIYTGMGTCRPTMSLLPAPTACLDGRGRMALYIAGTPHETATNGCHCCNLTCCSVVISQRVPDREFVTTPMMRNQTTTAVVRFLVVPKNRSGGAATRRKSCGPCGRSSMRFHERWRQRRSSCETAKR